MAAQERQQEMIRDFKQLQTWEERYKKIIDIGKQLPELSEEFKKDENLVKGCQSQVWLVAEFKEGRVYFKGDSDALIVRGLVGLLLKLYSDSTPQEILETAPEFLKELGFESNLSPSRANGLYSMIKQIKYYATAFQYLASTQK